MSTKIILVRHGQSIANKEQFFGGQTDVELTELGVKQAQIVANFVASNYHVDAVYCSNLLRALHTADIVAKPLDCKVQRDGRLNEFFAGEWEGKPFAEIQRLYPKEYDTWVNDFGRVKIPNGETPLQVQKRGYEAMQDIAKANDGKTVVVVTHRGLIRCLQCLWEHRPIEDINKCQWLSNCSVSEIVVDNGVLIPTNVGQDDFMFKLATPVTSTM